MATSSRSRRAPAPKAASAPKTAPASAPKTDTAPTAAIVPAPIAAENAENAENILGSLSALSMSARGDLPRGKVFVPNGPKDLTKIRGNIKLFFIAFSYGVEVNLARFINPNGDGKGAVPAYVAEYTGIPVVTVTYEGRNYYTFPKLFEDSVKATLASLGCSVEDLYARILSDYRSAAEKGCKYSKGIDFSFGS